MENNCLVTRLKQAIDNDNLKKFGSLRVDIKQTESTSYNDYHMLIYADYITIEVLNENGTNYGFWLSQNEWGNQSIKLKTYTFDLGTGADIYFEPGNYRVIIKNKYGIKQIHLANVNSIIFYDMDYVLNLRTLRINRNSSVFPLEELKNSINLGQCWLIGSNVYGDISALRNNINIYDLNVESNNNISGNIMDLVNLKILTSFNATYNYNMKGEVTEYANALFNDQDNPRTSGTLTINMMSSGLRYNGKAHNKVVITFTENGPTYVVS